MMTTADRIIIGCIFGIAAAMAYLGFSGLPFFTTSSIFLLCGLGFFYLASAFWSIRRKENKAGKAKHQSSPSGFWRK